MLSHETTVAGQVQNIDLMLSVDRNSRAGSPTESPVQPARLSVIRKALPRSEERKLRNTEQLRRLDLFEFTHFISLKPAPKLDHSHTPEGFLPAHPSSQRSATSGNISCFTDTLR